MEITEIPLNDGWWFTKWIRWCPTSMAALANAESQMLKYLKTSFHSFFVSIGSRVGNQENLIRTVALNETSPNVPLVLIHGFGSAVGLWVLNLDSLSINRPTYAFDVLGFGRSSRPKFSSDPVEAESQFVESIEDWRSQVKLEKMILLGHSLGGFLAASYAIRYPNRVKHLILADVWGGGTQNRILPFWARTIIALLQSFNPLATIRAAGPMGPYLINKLRPDLKRKFLPIVAENDVVSDYIYHCNAQTPSGEAAFRYMNTNLGWAKQPIIPRLGNLSPNVPITFIYGARSWIDRRPGVQLQQERKNVNMETIAGAGHHVYADHADKFNEIVNRIGMEVDNKFLHHL